LVPKHGQSLTPNTKAEAEIRAPATPWSGKRAEQHLKAAEEKREEGERKV